MAESIGFHKDCSGEIVKETVSIFDTDKNVWTFPESETWICEKCNLKMYDKDQLKRCLEPRTYLRWLTDKETGRRFSALVTDPQMGSPFES